MLKKLRKSLIWYVFVAPTFFLYGLFVAYPTFETFRLSFFHEVATRQEFIGALHYVRLLSNQVFLAALLNTAFLGIMFLLIIIPLSLVMASLLNNLRVWPNLFKAI
jgi:ABC-type sugar transport system permease subunit